MIFYLKKNKVEMIEYLKDSKKATDDKMTYSDADYYNKLIRDRIPEIIEGAGKNCIVEVMDDETYIKYLDSKLSEELAEYQESKSLEELADLLEVIRAVAVARGSSIEEVEAIRRDKAEKRGGFEKRILLTEVIAE